MTSAMLDEIKQGEKLATPRPWSVSEIGRYIEAYDGEATIAQVSGFDGNVHRAGSVDNDANARLIVSAVNNLPELLRLARLGLQWEASGLSAQSSKEERSVREAVLEAELKEIIGHVFCGDRKLDPEGSDCLTGLQLEAQAVLRGERMPRALVSDPLADGALAPKAVVVSAAAPREEETHPEDSQFDGMCDPERVPLDVIRRRFPDDLSPFSSAMSAARDVSFHVNALCNTIERLRAALVKRIEDGPVGPDVKSGGPLG